MLSSSFQSVCSFSDACVWVVPCKETIKKATNKRAAQSFSGRLLEHTYWNYVQNNDLPGYLGLWHRDFPGWPSVNAAPVHKDHITDWITAQTSRGLAFKIVEFKPAAIQVNDDVAVTCYWITYKCLDKNGNGAAHTLRITHTLLRDGKDWHIIGGMSAGRRECAEVT